MDYRGGWVPLAVSWQHTKEYTLKKFWVKEYA